MTQDHPPVLFVGAGPGDPELITVKGQKALAKADLVIYAGSLVPEAVLQWTPASARILNSAGMTLAEIVAEMENAWLEGQQVVRLHTGDPSLYGAIFEQMAELNRQSIPYRVVPGVTAAFAAAAAMGIEYTLPEISQTLIITRMEGRTPVPQREALASLASHKATMAIYLSIGLIDKVVEVLQAAYGRTAACAVVYRASQPEEKIVFTTLDRLEEEVRRAGIRKQAVIIVGRVLDVSLESLQHKSKLYDAGFAHGYRSGDPESRRARGQLNPNTKKTSSMTRPHRIAIWALTREGARLGRRMRRLLTGSHLFLGGRAGDTVEKEIQFDRLGDALQVYFHRYSGHVFIMATGIVVRSVAPLLQHKTKDPAVVVVDECGQHAISLLSGHLGGANALARRIGDGIGARPVITTATDLQKVPAIDLIAQERGLFIETPESIRHVSMALLEGRSISLHDPYGCLAGALPDERLRANGIATGSADREKKISCPVAPACG